MDVDFERYVGTNVELVFVGAAEGLESAELAQIQSWADRMQEVSGGVYKVVLVDCGGHNRQLDELSRLLVEDEANARRYLAKEAPAKTRLGKGQRKANRRDRWK